MILNSGAKYEEKPIFYLKNDKNLVNFDPSTNKSKKICTLIAPFSANDLNKYSGVIFHDTKKSCKV